MSSGHEQGNTRARIQTVALELFVEQGYDKTSLREIAERLGVTKAALYYHFRTKDEIVASAVEDLLAEIDAIIEWGRSQPGTAETRLEILRRYAEATRRWKICIRFFHHNPQTEAALNVRFKQRIGDLHGLLVDSHSPLLQRLRAFTAIVGIHISLIAFADGDFSDQQLHNAALTLAAEMVTRPESPPVTSLSGGQRAGPVAAGQGAPAQ